MKQTGLLWKGWWTKLLSIHELLPNLESVDLSGGGWTPTWLSSAPGLCGLSFNQRLGGDPQTKWESRKSVGDATPSVQHPSPRSNIGPTDQPAHAHDVEVRVWYGKLWHGVVCSFLPGLRAGPGPR